MCGRLNISDMPAVQALLSIVGATPPGALVPRFNVSPTQPVWCLVNGKRVVTMDWGFISPWAATDSNERVINARSEAIWDKPTFRNHISQHRCVVPVNGFYEWARQGRLRQPYHFTRTDGSAMALAGIYQHGPEPRVCLLTTSANDVMAPIHHRMPVVLETSAMETWITDSDRARLQELMAPAQVEVLQAIAVASNVNNPRHDAPDCLQPGEHQNGLF